VRAVTTSRAVKLKLVCPSVVSVAGGFCVVSGRDVMLGIGMFVTDSSYVLILVVVKAVDVSIELVGTFGFVVCRFVHSACLR
jgi:hypothetical protein